MLLYREWVITEERDIWELPITHTVIASWRSNSNATVLQKQASPFRITTAQPAAVRITNQHEFKGGGVPEMLQEFVLLWWATYQTPSGLQRENIWGSDGFILYLEGPDDRMMKRFILCVFALHQPRSQETLLVQSLELWAWKSSAKVSPLVAREGLLYNNGSKRMHLRENCADIEIFKYQNVTITFNNMMINNEQNVNQLISMIQACLLLFLASWLVIAVYNLTFFNPQIICSSRPLPVVSVVR